MALASDYRFRGISQNDKNPTPEASINWSGPDGFYAGTWLAKTNWTSVATCPTCGASPTFEMDLYAGKHFDLDGTDLNIEAYYYSYPDANKYVLLTTKKASYYETIVQLTHTFGPLSLSRPAPIRRNGVLAAARAGMPKARRLIWSTTGCRLAAISAISGHRMRSTLVPPTTRIMTSARRRPGRLDARRPLCRQRHQGQQIHVLGLPTEGSARRLRGDAYFQYLIAVLGAGITPQRGTPRAPVRGAFHRSADGSRRLAQRADDAMTAQP